jgi:acetylglutamate kinase
MGRACRYLWKIQVEGKESMSTQVTPLQMKILSSLVFVESFDHILEEVGESEPIVTAEIRTLIDRRFIQVMEPTSAGFRKTVFYDADDMRAFYYTATSKALGLYGGKTKP